MIGDTIRIYNITSQICSRGLKESLDFIVDTVRREWAKLVVIDSLRGLKHVLDVDVRDRGTIFDRAAQLSIFSCTSILIGESTVAEHLTEPEFAIADGIIHLRHIAEGVQEHRTLRVTKMRGAKSHIARSTFRDAIGYNGVIRPYVAHALETTACHAQP